MYSYSFETGRLRLPVFVEYRKVEKHFYTGGENYEL